MATRIVNNSVDSNEEHDLQDQSFEIFMAWKFVFMSIDFAINSPQSVLVPDDIRCGLEIAKKKLESLMAYYEQDSIEEIETRA